MTKPSRPPHEYIPWQKYVASKLNEILAKLDRLLPPSVPGSFGFRVTGHQKQGDQSVLTFAIVNIPAVDLSDPANSDVETRTMLVKIGPNATPITVVVPGLDAVDELDDPGFVGNDQDAIIAAYTYADGASPPNVSAPRIETFTLTDTVAPSQPGEFGIKATGQAPAPAKRSKP
jgi:hypothetical protein